MVSGWITGTPRVAAAAPFSVIGHTSPTTDLPRDPAGGPVAGGLQGYAESSLLLDPPQRRGYQLSSFTNSSQTKVYVGIDVIDLDTLQVLRTVVIPDYEATVAVPGIAQRTLVATLQPGPQPRLFFVTPGDPKGKAGAFNLVTVDLTTMTVVHDATIQGPSNQCIYGGFLLPNTCPIFGVSYDARSRLVYLMAADRSTQVLTQYSQYTLSAVAYDPSTAAVAARVTLPSVCDGPPSSDPGGGTTNFDQAPIFRSTDGGTIWTVCDTQSNQSFTQGSLVAAVGMPADPASGLPLTGQTAGVYSSFPDLMDAYADPGSNRLFFRAQTFGGDNSVVVFDGDRHTFVGLVSLNRGRFRSDGGSLTIPSEADGVDPTTGRFYHVTLDAIYMADGRRTAREGFPQAAVFPADGQGRYGHRSLAVDWVKHHVFVMYANYSYDGGPNDKIDNFYTVYQDDVPLSHDTKLSSLDGNTADIAPGAGTTEIYAGHAQGFGSRSFLLHPADFANAGQTVDFKDAGGEHDVYEALVGDTRGAGLGADLSNSAAQGTGYSVGVDSHTRGSYPDQSLPVPAFPYGVVPCHDTQGSVDKVSSADPGGYTTATCDLAKQEVSITSLVGGSAVSPSYNAPVPDVASSQITTDVRFDPARQTSVGAVPTMVSYARATVRGITLAQGITIDSVIIEATAVSGGRSGTVTTTLKRTLSGVRTPSYSCTTQCDPQDAVRQINAALQAQFPGQVQVVMPDADKDAAAGTPHGYYAAVYKDAYEYLNDSLVDRDLRPEVVGLEEIRNNSEIFAGEQARQIIDLGGVEVESRFGITRTDLFDDSVPPSDVSPGAPLSGVLGPVPLGPGAAIAPVGGASAALGGDQGGSLYHRIVQSILQGLSAFLDVHQLPLMATIWSLLLLPGYLATRRRRLERYGL